MSIEFIGYIGGHHASEIHPRSGPTLQPDYVETVARAHEDAGFDRALVAFHSNSPDSTLIASHAASVTKKLQFLIAHRPGFTQPTLAARQFATLDVFNGGRTAVHIITGGDDRELRADGSHIGKDERYARTDEYLSVVRQEWTREQPFDFKGTYYQVEGAHSTVKSPQQPHIPLYFGGSSTAAIEVAGKHADVYALWGETYEQVREIVTQVRAEAAKHGRTIRFSLSLRPILAETEELAWARADKILQQATELAEKNGFVRREPPNEGSRRLLAAAAQGSRLDKRLWTGIAALLGAQGNSTSLVGTAEQVAQALLDYYDLGITTFLIRGFDPLNDAIDYGKRLIPLTRQLVAEREQAKQVA
ncbi:MULTISPECIES: LLM class flavin-dependent oxidoreductase [Pseudomonas]|uniref:LLM class flavin-dependent oxidoreductase n=1 Tax=Pseudomonas pergaminensis TaxID=2853159 RepID=A0ABD7TPG5_9PSED|nr:MULTISPECIES: LLM class flavin-dependent oxidoreductase [Pseudomonas]AQT93914.1 alkanesulfonate monooxygenase [Pseudomonas azotoformans]MBT1262051.1 LLM class flavin-dependent oxidoreductase [Pseudomonas sp. VS40]MBT1273966.1 LLM class flavin-dependent oxidoreductase [Pseudomonas sp. VS59]PJK33444.1 LLM class flavin-dependent oxidoreductase [Pseudomonas sp. S09F 262]PJK42940.1 LLM class flavin-dependent oxidoreductase [Pseudomonas sp. S10E 269]